MLPCRGFVSLNNIDGIYGNFFNFQRLLSYYSSHFIDYYSILGGDRHSSSLNYRFENFEKTNKSCMIANDCINKKSIIMGRFVNSDNEKEKYPIISYNNISILSFGNIENIEEIKSLYFTDKIKHSLNQDELILNCYIYMVYRYGRTIKSIMELSKDMKGKFSFIIYDSSENKLFIYVNGISLYLDYKEKFEIEICSDDNILTNNFFTKELSNVILEIDTEKIKLLNYKKITSNNFDVFINPMNTLFFYDEIDTNENEIKYVISSIIEISPNMVLYTGKYLSDSFEDLSKYTHIEIPKNDMLMNLFKCIIKFSFGTVFIFNYDTKQTKLISDLRELIKILNLNINVIPIYTDISWSYQKYLDNIKNKNFSIENEMEKSGVDHTLIYNFFKRFGIKK